MLACCSGMASLSGQALAREVGAEAMDVAADALLPPPTPLTASQALYLETTLNQAPRGLLRFDELGGRLQAPAATLRQLGFPVQGDSPVYLDQLAGVVVHYDAGLQILDLQVPLQLLQLPTAQLGRSAQGTPAAQSSPGMALNYDLYASHSDGLGNLSLNTDLRLFGVGRGSLRSTGLMRTYQLPGEGWQHQSVRLDTSWRLDLPDQALSLTVGDFYSGFLEWSRPARMAGIQIGRNYGLQPYRVLTPTPSFLGEAVVPSNVELYVDGLRQYGGQVPVGPFQLATQPGISGTGTAQVVVTDAFGRMQTLDFSFYGTQQLLAAGLSDWSAGIGRLRRDFGIHSFRYDSDTVASATLRRGISNQFTLEAHAEGGGGVLNAGVGGAWLLGRAGVLSANWSESRDDQRRGRQYGMGYNWNNRRFNVNLASRRTSGDYRDLGSLQDSLPPRISEQASFGVDLQRLGTVSLSYLRLDQAVPVLDAPQPAPGPGLPYTRTRYLSLFWSRSFGRWNAYLSATQDIDQRQNRSIYLSLGTRLGEDRQATLAVQRNGDVDRASAEVMRPVPGDGSRSGPGWRLQARDDGGLAEIGALGSHGRYSAGLSRDAGQTFAYGNASGSLVWMAGSVFAAREVPDAFAVVSTGRPGIPVMLENRPVGVTNRNGLLLVTPLLSWQRNRLGIDTLDLPADMRAERVETFATPRQGAGMRVDFKLVHSRGALLTLLDEAGQPLPLGARISGAGVTPTVVGHDGQAWVEFSGEPPRLLIESERGRCHVQMPASTSRRSPPLRCLPEPAP